MKSKRISIRLGQLIICIGLLNWRRGRDLFVAQKEKQNISRTVLYLWLEIMPVFSNINTSYAELFESLKRGYQDCCKVATIRATCTLEGATQERGRMLMLYAYISILNILGNSKKLLYDQNQETIHFLFYWVGGSNRFRFWYHSDLHIWNTRIAIFLLWICVINSAPFPNICRQ